MQVCKPQNIKQEKFKIDITCCGHFVSFYFELETSIRQMERQQKKIEPDSKNIKIP